MKSIRRTRGGLTSTRYPRPEEAEGSHYIIIYANSLKPDNRHITNRFRAEKGQARFGLREMRLLDFLTRNVEGAVLIRKTKSTFQSQIHSFGVPDERPCELFSSRNFALAEILVGCESLQLKKNI